LALAALASSLETPSLTGLGAQSEALKGIPGQ
jgi:hypothetical protein